MWNGEYYKALVVVVKALLAPQITTKVALEKSNGAEVTKRDVHLPRVSCDQERERTSKKATYFEGELLREWFVCWGVGWFKGSLLEEGFMWAARYRGTVLPQACIRVEKIILSRCHAQTMGKTEVKLA